MAHATEEGVMTLVLSAELGVNERSMDRYESGKDWPEDSVALYIEQRVCIKQYTYTGKNV